MQAALNTIWKTRSRETALSRLIRARVASLGLVAALGFLLVVSLVVSAGLTAFANYLDRLPVGTLILSSVNFAVSWLLFALLFGAIYKVLPDRTLQWKDVIVGASSYGAAGGLIVLLLWVYYSAQIFLFGAEFTKTYANTHGSKRRKPAAD
jgi:membrane protein